MTHDVTLLMVTERVVREEAPDELAGLGEAVEAYLASPRAGDALRRGGSEAVASGYAVAGEMLSTLAIAVATDIAKDLVLHGAKAIGKKLGARRVLPWRRRAMAAQTVVPPIEPDDASTLEERAADIARARGASDERARKVAVRIAEAWPRVESP